MAVAQHLTQFVTLVLWRPISPAESRGKRQGINVRRRAVNGNRQGEVVQRCEGLRVHRSRGWPGCVRPSHRNSGGGIPLVERRAGGRVRHHGGTERTAGRERSQERISVIVQKTCEKRPGLAPAFFFLGSISQKKQASQKPRAGAARICPRALAP